MAAIARVSARLATARRVTVLTGAGVSAASGVATFRGAGGLWRHHRPEELATPEAFARDPALVWEWYDGRRASIAAARPNAAHEVLAAWSRRFEAFTLVTQNVDGLHERADTAGVLRFHGSIWELRCVGGCCAPWEDLRATLPELPARCPGCGGLARPGVVWFGEGIDPEVLERSVESAQRADVFLVVGTAAVVHPAAGLVGLAREAGAFTVEVNPDATPVSGAVDVVLAQGAELCLPRLDAALPPDRT